GHHRRPRPHLHAVVVAPAADGPADQPAARPLMSSAAVVKRMVTPAEIDATFTVMQQLRPAVVAQEYRTTVQRMMAGGFHLAAVVVGGEVQAVAGYRFAEG